ncbi:DUF397 domain-containing protein [Actinoplanes sp. NPDC051633]|uniref:DUF397 domain-containing protein n=1 Tax=Actinoplanes sp. NPDC051633 TaxID=3155670 RepID=UPI00341A8D5F
MAESTRPLEWRRASRCAGGNCIEVARDGDRYLIRDSRDPDARPLQVSAAEWAAFVGGVRDGEFEFD